MKKVVLFIILLTGKLCGQTITPQVINAAGSHREVTGTGVWITDNVGEPFTETIGGAVGVMITQGFIQPSANGLQVIYNGLTCTDRNDGMISVSRTSSNLSPITSETYIWSPAEACPSGNCGNKVSNLRPGTYGFMLITGYANGKSDTIRRNDIIILNSSEPCRVKVYSGVTANGDGLNDVWMIEGIEAFPNNHVTIYNRWGKQLYDVKGYDNDTRIWPDKQADGLIASTYFYIIELGDGSGPIKGWVELIKN